MHGQNDIKAEVVLQPGETEVFYPVYLRGTVNISIFS